MSIFHNLILDGLIDTNFCIQHVLILFNIIIDTSVTFEIHDLYGITIEIKHIMEELLLGLCFLHCPHFSLSNYFKQESGFFLIALRIIFITYFLHWFLPHCSQNYIHYIFSTFSSA